MTDFDFDREVFRIGRRRAIAFFAPRLFVLACLIAAGIYFGAIHD